LSGGSLIRYRTALHKQPPVITMSPPPTPRIPAILRQ
jgi:hypothetical protein